MDESNTLQEVFTLSDGRKVLVVVDEDTITLEELDNEDDLESSILL